MRCTCTKWHKRIGPNFTFCVFCYQFFISGDTRLYTFLNVSNLSQSKIDSTSSSFISFHFCLEHQLTSSPVFLFTRVPLHLCPTSPVSHFTCVPFHLCPTSPVFLFTCVPLHLCSSSPVSHFTCLHHLLPPGHMLTAPPCCLSCLSLLSDQTPVHPHCTTIIYVYLLYIH